MDSLSQFDLKAFLTPGFATALFRALLILLVGLPFFFGVSRWIRRAMTEKYTAQRAMLVSRLFFYTGVLVVAISALNEMGFSLAPVLGAAGILGIALGFASQTSVSNIISGLFLVTEEPFVIGDIISMSGITGEVISVDLLSVKLRTLDNRFVRLPNESVVKSEVINLTRFPIRRLEINLYLAYKEDVGKVREILQDVVRQNPLALHEPEPIIVFNGFGNSSIDLMLGVWVTRQDYLKLKNSIQEQIKARLDAEGIEMPFPHLSLYAGSTTQPFPVKLVHTDEKRDADPPA